MIQILLGCELVLILLLFRAFYRRGLVRGCHSGYAQGRKDGYECGRVDAEKWWLEQGAEVEKEREKMWREMP